MNLAWPGLNQPGGGRTRAHTNHFHHTRSDVAMFELKLPHIPPLGKASATKDTSGTPGPLPHLTSRRISPPSRFRASSEPQNTNRGDTYILPASIPQNIALETCKLTMYQVWGPSITRGGMCEP